MNVVLTSINSRPDTVLDFGLDSLELGQDFPCINVGFILSVSLDVIRRDVTALYFEIDSYVNKTV